LGLNSKGSEINDNTIDDIEAIRSAELSSIVKAPRSREQVSPRIAITEASSALPVRIEQSALVQIDEQIQTAWQFGS
jgi:hypothetical protein